MESISMPQTVLPSLSSVWPGEVSTQAIQTQIPQSFHRLIFGFLHPGSFHQVSHGDLPQV